MSLEFLAISFIDSELKFVPEHNYLDQLVNTETTENGDIIRSSESMRESIEIWSVNKYITITIMHEMRIHINRTNILSHVLL